MKIIDRYNVGAADGIFTVQLAPGFMVDVKAFADTGCVYVMQNHDGSTVYGDYGTDFTFPDYQYDEAAVTKLVREEFLRALAVKKFSLDSLIKAASDRANVAAATDLAGRNISAFEFGRG